LENHMICAEAQSVQALMSDFEPLEGEGTRCPDLASVADIFASIDAIYCISLRDEPNRTAGAKEHFRSIGLARHITLFRATRGAHRETAIWTSHREVAKRAVSKGHKRILILEDDARFSQAAQILRSRIDRAISSLPRDWHGLYLIHLPMQAYPVGTGVLRVRSGGAIAYVANAPLLRWIAAVEPMDCEIPVCQTIGTAIDGAFANLPHMFAVFPMLGRHAYMGGPTQHAVPPRRLELNRLFNRRSFRKFLAYRFARPGEILALMLFFYHALTLEYFRRRSGVETAAKARSLRESGVFDAVFYLVAYPDVAASGMDPLFHYLRHGAREGRSPGGS